ncbi:MAG TPA: FkbM family methyltransferase, partial [Thermoanaerobaculia bacterium]|nr:FkbM family methyltransferase [Thermoanaerobaculia bacterium]
YYALLAASKGAKVHAFEIQADIAGILRRNIERNGLQESITVVEMGCFSKEGEATIEHRGDAGSARLDMSGGGVPLTTIDAYVTRAGVERVDVILVDAEGADLEVLKGAEKVLERSRPAVMAEVHHLEAFGGSEQELRGYMARLGYEARTLFGEFSTDLLFLPKTP